MAHFFHINNNVTSFLFECAFDLGIIQPKINLTNLVQNVPAPKRDPALSLKKNYVENGRLRFVEWFALPNHYLDPRPINKSPSNHFKDLKYKPRYIEKVKNFVRILIKILTIVNFVTIARLFRSILKGNSFRHKNHKYYNASSKDEKTRRTDRY